MLLSAERLEEAICYNIIRTAISVAENIYHGLRISNNNNSIQFRLFMCKLNSLEANFKASTSREEKNTYIQTKYKKGNNNNNNNSIDTSKSEK
jgi:hypothetical protein